MPAAIALIYLVIVLGFLLIQVVGPWRKGWRLRVRYDRRPELPTGRHSIILANDHDEPIAFRRFELVRSRKRSTADMAVVSDRVDGGAWLTVEPHAERWIVFREAPDLDASANPRRDYGPLYVRIWPDRRSEPLWYRLFED